MRNRAGSSSAVGLIGLSLGIRTVILIELEQEVLVASIQGSRFTWGSVWLQTYWKEISIHFNTAEVLRVLELSEW